MNAIQQAKHYNPLKLWKRRNRGICAALARHPDVGVTKQFVSGVLNRKYYSGGGVIEGLLAELGAPGMRERRDEARLRGPNSDRWTRNEVKRLLAQLKRIQGAKVKAA